MNWLLFIRTLRKAAAERRLETGLSDDLRAAFRDDIADAAEATLEIMQEQERRKLVTGTLDSD